MGALSEVDAALAIDPGFLAARALRDTILTSSVVPSARIKPDHHALFDTHTPNAPSTVEEPNVDRLTYDAPAWVPPRSRARSHPIATTMLMAAVAAAAFAGGVWWSSIPSAAENRAVEATSPVASAEPDAGTADTEQTAHLPDAILPDRQSTETQTPESGESETPKTDARKAVTREPRVTAPSDDQQVRDALERFRVAYNARAASHRENGTSVLAFERCDVSVAATSGTAVCARTSGPDDQSVWTFSLANTGHDWVIKSIALR